MTDTISEIAEYLRRQPVDTEELIEEKSKERVLTGWAAGIKKNKPLPKGRCNGCGREDNKLVPTTLKVCVTCCNKMMQRGGQLKILNKEAVEYFCDQCFARCFVNFYINPNLCQVCVQRLGKTHREELHDHNKHEKNNVYRRKNHEM